MFLELNRVKSYISAQKKANPDLNVVKPIKQSFGQSERYEAVNPANSISNFGNHQQFNKQTNFARRMEIDSNLQIQNSDKRQAENANKQLFIGAGSPRIRGISGDSQQNERPKEAYCLKRNNFLLNDLQSIDGADANSNIKV